MVASSKGRTEKDALVERLHHAVGGPAALSTFVDPTTARTAVLAVLADQQTDAVGARRVLHGDLTPRERRTVRTVTNRGAAARSRVRQKRELARLREEILRKDAQLRRLEAVFEELSVSITSHAESVLQSDSVTPINGAVLQQPQSPYASSFQMTYRTPCDSSPSSGSVASLDVELSIPVPSLFSDMSMDRDLFGSLVDQLIVPIS